MMRQMTWEDWNPYRGIGPRQILTVLVICLFASLAWECIGIFRERHTGKTWRKGRWLWTGFTAFYIYTIFCATILGRQYGKEPEVRTRLLWTLEAALQTGEWTYWYFIVGNILMFVPLGFALMHLLISRTESRSKNSNKNNNKNRNDSRHQIENRNVQLWRCFAGVVAICLLLSIVIEGIQYVTGSGLSEFDDLLHNTLGGGIGGLCYQCYYQYHISYY